MTFLEVLSASLHRPAAASGHAGRRPGRAVRRIVAATVMIAAVALTGCAQPAVTPAAVPDANAGAASNTVEAAIDRVELVSVSAAPPFITVALYGNFPDACSQIDDVQVRQADATFAVQMTISRLPNARCAPQPTPFVQTVDLDMAGLPAGQYTVVAGDVSTTISWDASEADASSQPLRLPLAFVPNQGQSDPAVLLEAHSQAGSLFFTETGVTVVVPGAAVPLAVEFQNASQSATVQGTSQLPGVVNIYHGRDQSGWRDAIPTYESLAYRGIYDGIDLVYDGSEGLLKGTWMLAPGADPSLIRWRYSGGGAPLLDIASGDLHIPLDGAGRLVEKAPVAWQEEDGRRTPVTVHYDLSGDTIGFALGEYDRTLPLVIDPTLVYSSYLGGGSADLANDVALDAAGNLYLAGHTYSSSFPGATGGNAGRDDVFVTKINPAGTAVLYTTILGGLDGEQAKGIAVNAVGDRVWITGETSSANFPTRNAFQSQLGGGYDAFVAQLGGNGALAFSSYLGSYLMDDGRAIALDSNGDVHLAGSLIGGFFGKVDGSTYQLLYTRMIPGQEAAGNAIALDAQNNIYITGEVRSDSWPTVSPVQATCGRFDNWTCSTDAFVVKLPPAGDDLLFSTYLGGSAANGGSGTDIGRAIAVDSSGAIFVGGETFAGDFPVVNAFQNQKRGQNNFSDGFVARLDRQGAGYRLAYSTYLGGQWTDAVSDLALAAGGSLMVTGWTDSADYPVQAAIQPQIGPGVCFGGTSRNCLDAFLTQFAANGTVPFSTFLGGTNDDVAGGVGVDGTGRVYVAGRTESGNFPVTPGALQTQRNGSQDAFVVKIDMNQTPPPPAGLTPRVYLPMVLH